MDLLGLKIPGIIAIIILVRMLPSGIGNWLWVYGISFTFLVVLWNSLLIARGIL